MATNISEQLSLSKFGSLLFARQTPMLEAERHRGWLSRLNEWRTRRAAISELSGLSDRELSDIGLTRQEIPVVVRKGR